MRNREDRLKLQPFTMSQAKCEAVAALPEGGRLRHVRVIRDYGMFDRREAPQYYPAVERRPGGG